VALEAVRGEKTIAQLSSQFGVHGNQMRQWRRQLLDELPSTFADGRKRSDKDSEQLTAELYRQIGQLKVELDWLKKKLQCSVEQKRDLVGVHHGEISVMRQCELLGVSRSTYYYRPRPIGDLNLELMRLIDEQYTKTPILRRSTDDGVANHKRVERLMRVMGLQAVYPRRRSSIPSKEHKIYPYLLRGVEIEQPDEVWCADITYIRMLRGFLYLVAIMDWYSRYVLAWELSITVEKEFCLEALDKALKVSCPTIFNTDQGSQFTSREFTGRLETEGIAISMEAGAGSLTTSSLNGYGARSSMKRSICKTMVT